MILINLLPPDLKRRETSKLVMPEIPIKKTLISLAAGLVVIQVLLSVVALGVAMRASGVKHEIATLSEQLQETKKIKSQTISSQNKLRDIRALTAEKFYWASVLSALTESATKGVWLRSLVLTEGLAATAKRAPPAVKGGGTAKRTDPATAPKTKIVKLEGSVYAPGQETAYIGKFVKALKDHETLKNLFSEIELSNINQRKINEYDVFDFVLFCKFKRDKI